MITLKRTVDLDDPQVGERVVIVWMTGDPIEEHRQAYTLERIESYRRRDGVMSSVLTWTTPCRECGEAFEIRTGVKGARLGHWMRCKAHRKPWNFGKQEQAK